MKRLLTALVALVLLLPVAPAHARDPQSMTHAEWGAVKYGMTRAKVNTVCGCIGVRWLDLTDGTVIYQYLSPVGIAQVEYRPHSGVLEADPLKFWCPGHQACDVVHLP